MICNIVITPVITGRGTDAHGMLQGFSAHFTHSVSPDITDNDNEVFLMFSTSFKNMIFDGNLSLIT